MMNMVNNTSEQSNEIFRALRESQNKYVYFLLATSAAGIGLAVQQTSNTALSLSQIPLGVAVLLWGVSFYCGCLHISYINSTLYANGELLSVERGEHPEVSRLLIPAASEGIKEAMQSNSNIANRYGRWQFKLLILGAAFYIFWHIMVMYIASL